MVLALWRPKLSFLVISISIALMERLGLDRKGRLNIVDYTAYVIFHRATLSQS